MYLRQIIYFLVTAKYILTYLLKSTMTTLLGLVKQNSLEFGLMKDLIGKTCGMCQAQSVSSSD